VTYSAWPWPLTLSGMTAWDAWVAAWDTEYACFRYFAFHPDGLGRRTLPWE
jgi:hypothetical protein